MTIDPALSSSLDTRRTRVIPYEAQCPRSDTRLSTGKERVPDVHYHFDASDNEIYAMLAAFEANNALTLLEAGIHHPDDANPYLRLRNAADLHIDKSVTVEELQRHGISAERAALGLLWLQTHETYECTAHGIANAIEFLWLPELSEEKFGNYWIVDVCLYLMDETFALDVVQELIPADNPSALSDMAIALRDLSAEVRQYDFTMDAMKEFIRKHSGKFEFGSKTSHLTEIFVHYGLEGVDRIKSLRSVEQYLPVAMRVVVPEEDPLPAAYVAGLLYEATLDHGVAAENENDSYRPMDDREGEFQNSQELHRVGIEPEIAAPYLVAGYSVNKIIGIVHGVEPVVAEGWL